MPAVPQSNLTAQNNLAGNLPESPARVGLVIGPSTGGFAGINEILLDSSVNAVTQNFGTGPASDVAAGALNENNHGAVYQIRTAQTVPGSIGGVTKTNGATVGSVVDDFGAILVPGATFDGDVLFTGKIEGAELEIVVGMATSTVVTSPHVKLTVTAGTTGAQLAALITGVPAALAIWGASAKGTGLGVCGQTLATTSETAGRIGIQALTSGLSYRMVISGTNTTRSVALTGGNTVDVIGATNANGEPTSTAQEVQNDLVALATANPGLFRSTLAGSGMGLLGAKALTALPFGSTGAMTVSGSPVDAYDVTVQIVTAGGLGAAAFRVSLGKANGVPVYGSAIYQIPSGGSVAIPGTGLTLAFTGAFDRFDLFSFVTVAPTSTLNDVADALDYFAQRPEQASLIYVAGEIPAVDLPSWIVALQVQMVALQDVKKYARLFLEVAPPGPGQSNAQWAAQLTSLTASLAADRIIVGGGLSNQVSALPLPQNARFESVNAGQAMFARALSLPSGVDIGDQTLSGAMTGVQVGLQVDVAPALAAARFSYNYLLSGVPGVQAELLLFDAPTGDFTYGTYGRVLDEAMFYGYLKQTKYLSTAVRRAANGAIDKGDALGIEQTLRQVLLDKIVKPGNATDAYVVVDTTNTDNKLKLTYYVQVLFYIKTIDGRAGIVKTLSQSVTI